MTRFGMRLTFRRKLLALAGIAGLALLLGLASNVMIARRVDRQLTTIQGRYVPRVELEARLQAQFERIGRAFQDAVAAHDVDALHATRALKSKFEDQLAAARDAVEPEAAARLRAALDDYCSAAESVSRRLIADETGEDVVNAMTELRAKHAHLKQTLNAVTRFEPHDLDEAFASTNRAVSSGSAYHLWISIGFLALVGGLLVAMHRDLLRVLPQLTAGFQRFGAGKFDQPIPVANHDELGDLAAGANKMAESLARAQAQLVKARQELEAKVEERTAELSKANEAVKQMNQELERRVEERTEQLRLANRELESFSYSVAHNLQTPLRGMNGFADVLLADYGATLNGEAKDCLQQIIKNSQRMSELIDALLLLSRVARVELRTTMVDLSSLVRSVVKELATAEPRAAYELVVAEQVRAELDPHLARAVFDNLLGNAWKFTSKVAVPRLEFGVIEENGRRTFFLRDNGAGFDMAYKDKLFRPFQRLHTIAEFPGTGVGLASVQRILERHGGRIWAEGAVGGGATFYFTLQDGPEHQASS
jgi:signal transduction histidine kinase